jgi:glycerophosphoryl diester phosphodiesterase
MKFPALCAIVMFLGSGASGAGPAVIGHRGARALAPENTLSGFRAALAAGADGVELDLNVTSDGVLVIAHDQAVDKEICLAPGGKEIAQGPAIRSLTLEQLRSYDCGSKRNPRFPGQKPSPGERMPAFSEFLAWAEGAPPGFILDLEAKSVPGLPGLAPEPGEFARLILAALEKHRLTQRAILKSFDYRVLLAAKALDPRIRTSLLTSDNCLDYVGAVLGARADILSPDHLWITREQVAELHARGIQVMPWTVNDPEGWRRMLDFGADAVITDDPAALRAFLRGR